MTETNTETNTAARSTNTSEIGTWKHADVCELRTGDGRDCTCESETGFYLIDSAHHRARPAMEDEMEESFLATRTDPRGLIASELGAHAYVDCGDVAPLADLESEARAAGEQQAEAWAEAWAEWAPEVWATAECEGGDLDYVRELIPTWIDSDGEFYTEIESILIGAFLEAAAVVVEAHNGKLTERHAARVLAVLATDASEFAREHERAIASYGPRTSFAFGCWGREREGCGFSVDAQIKADDRLDEETELALAELGDPCALAD